LYSAADEHLSVILKKLMSQMKHKNIMHCLPAVIVEVSEPITAALSFAAAAAAVEILLATVPFTSLWTCAYMPSLAKPFFLKRGSRNVARA